MVNEFFNEDKRLVPKSVPEVFLPISGPREYSVDSKSFPELHRVFLDLQEKAGISGHRLVIIGDNFGGAGVDFERKTVGIGIHKINNMSFDALKAIIAHEFGHVYLHQHPETPMIGKPVEGLNERRMEEVQSDRFAVCLLEGNREAIEAFTSGVTSDPDLPLNLREAAIMDFEPSSCPRVVPSSRQSTQKR